MKRQYLVLMIIGFFCIFLSAASGAFLSSELTQLFILDPSGLGSWKISLLKSAHGHFNLFGMILILISLSSPYSQLSPFLNRLRFAGCLSGCLAAGPGLLIHAFTQPNLNLNLITILLGAGFSFFLLALWIHMFGLLQKWYRHA